MSKTQKLQTAALLMPHYGDHLNLSSCSLLELDMEVPPRTFDLRGVPPKHNGSNPVPVRIPFLYRLPFSLNKSLLGQKARVEPVYLFKA